MRKILRNEDGQQMIEFALVFPVFLLFVFFLFASCMWGIASFFAHDVAIDTASFYATRAPEEGQEIAQKEKAKLNKWAGAFIVTQNTSVTVSQNSSVATATVTVTPKFKAPFGITTPTIKRTSQCVLEKHNSNPSLFSQY